MLRLAADSRDSGRSALGSAFPTDGSLTTTGAGAGTDIDTGTTTDAISCTAPYLFNLMSTQILHITSPNININSVSVKNTKKYNILASVHVNSAAGETQTYMNTYGFKYKISDYSISFITICIHDQDFNPVNFNNIDWF
jgi:hypothetical protein